MKNIAKYTALLLLLVGLSTYAFAQVSATATTSATIVAPIAISKTLNMNFGNVAVIASSGTVVLAPAGTRTSTGGVTLPATAGTVTAATFTVTGSSGYTYAITLPASATTIDDGASHTMTVDTWTSNPNSTGTLTAGTSTLTVGATLNVGASQVAGSYTSATPFTVTVNYN
ncbi:MAG: DUF4402 domain-containing protein [Bacteroidota bacterium]|jgi:hypothetical protein